MQEIDFSVLTAQQASRYFTAGETIFSAGDPAADMFAIKSGSVEIRLDGRVIETLGPQQVFGEMALIDGEPRSATAVAVEPVELVTIGERQFLYLVSETPYFALNVLRTLAGRLRTANKA